jgi:hypothetical protein
MTQIEALQKILLPIVERLAREEYTGTVTLKMCRGFVVDADHTQPVEEFYQLRNKIRKIAQTKQKRG